MYPESQIVDLLMAVFLTPIMIVALRSARLPGKRWYVFGYCAMVVGYALGVVALRFEPGSFTFVEHVAYVASGVGFVGGSWNLLVDARRRRPT